MGFVDRLRAWLRGDGVGSGDGRGARPDRSSDRSGDARSSSEGPRARGGRGRRPRSTRPSSSFDGSALLEFARSRSGVEVYLEPRTNLYGDSVLLVADDGEYLRRSVPDAQTARAFCAQHGIPVYDAARTGYPRRVRDYDRGVRPRRIGIEDLPPWPGADADPGPIPQSGAGPAGRPGRDDAGDDRAEEGDDEPPPPPVPPR